MTTLRTNPIRDSADFARVFGVSRETLGRLEAYARLLKQWQRTINLVAPSTLDEVWHRHFTDSAQVLAVAEGALAEVPKAVVPPHPGPPPRSEAAREARRGREVPTDWAPPSGMNTTRSLNLPLNWVDLGSGAGFPGLVVAILLAEARPGSRVTLIDSDQRKCAFLREVVRETGLQGHVAVDILCARIETPANHSKVRDVDIVSARALAPLSKLLQWSLPFFGPKTVGCYLKGRDAAAEVAAAQAEWAFETDMVESVTSAEARIVVVRTPRALG